MFRIGKSVFMNWIRKQLTFYKQVKDLAIAPWVRLLSRLPISSKHIGSPKGYYLTSKQYCEVCQANASNAVNFYKQFLPSSTIERNLPKSIYNQIHWKFLRGVYCRVPETFVLSVVDGRILTDSGTIVASDDRLILDVSLQFGIGCDETKVRSHNAFKYLKLPRCQVKSQTTAVLATSGAGGIFHWLTDALPRFEILRRTLSDEIDCIDRYVVNEGSPIIKETLEILGISQKQLILADSKLHIQSQHLVVPSLPSSTGNPPAWVITFLRESFLSYKANIDSPKRIYISRSKARSRKVRNEEDVFKCLAEFDFATVWLEDHDLSTQIAILANAEFIIAPHGAGLTNLVWCNPKAKVLEIFSPNYVNVCFWAIANQVGLDYFYLIGDGKRPDSYSDSRLARREDITVPIGELCQVLHIFLE